MTFIPSSYGYSILSVLNLSQESLRKYNCESSFSVTQSDLSKCQTANQNMLRLFLLKQKKGTSHCAAVKSVLCHGAVTVIFIDFKLFWQQQ